MKKKFLSLAFFAAILLLNLSCYKNEEIDAPIRPYPTTDDEIELYIQENYVEEYGVAVRFKYVDRYVEPNKRVVPPRRELVVPMLEFLNDLWIDPYKQVDHGEEFFREHVPAEMIFIGSSIFNDDGTVTLGTADAGARITLTEVNDIDVENQAWVFRQLGTIYHEFAHIVHQRYSLPPGWQTISPEGYTSAGSWYNLTDEEALQRGFVSPYSTVNFNEDFAELVAHILFYPDFDETFLNIETCDDVECTKRNEGRVKLKRKYNAVRSHYLQNTGVDLLELREIIQAKLQ
jgi:substrate import-associated zinc metallohydrolase lipoprotein